MTYSFSDFMQHVRAAPMVSPIQAGQPRTHRAGQATGSVHDMLAAARGPGDDGGGTRHHTLLTLVGALVHYGWSDLAIHAGLTLPANELWGGDDRHKVVQDLIDHARRKEAVRTTASPVRRVRWGRG
jgi:hypothetical protein